MESIQKDIDNICDLYFKQPLILYEHIFSSYNQFIEEIIPYCLKQETNYFYENIDNHLINFHGFKCDNIRIKPATFDNDNEIKFPHQARKNHLNYFASIIVDIKQYVETYNILTNEKTIKEVHKENNIAVANIPIMVKSKYCSTNIKKNSSNECKYDPGGYFLVNGQEKIILSIEKMVDNKILIFTKKDSTYENGLIYKAQINSRKNDWSDNLQITTIKNRKDGVIVLTSSQLVDIPIFIMMRALGFESDLEIISNICYSLDDIKMLNLLRPSMVYSKDEEGNDIKTKEEAINYLLSKLTKVKRISQTDEVLARKQKMIILDKILRQDLLRHLGEDILKKRAFIGLIVNKLLLVMLNKIEPDDRDELNNKRIETPGILLGQLFRQNWKKMLSEIGKYFKKGNLNDNNPFNVISQIKSTTIEQGIKTALSTGVWGLHRSKNGVAQALQRLSWIQSQSYFRRVISPATDTATSSITSMRHVNNNQYKFLCLTGDATILLSNNIDSIEIKNINNKNNSVLTINSETLNSEPSNIHSFFSIIPDKLFEIITVSGRRIKATKDHPFLVNNNKKYEWKRVNELSEDDFVMIKHTLTHIPDENITNVSLNNILILEHYKNQLLENNYLDNNIEVNRLKIIARLIGSLNTTGHINSINKENMSYNTTFYVKSRLDAMQIVNDIKELGFGSVSIIENNNYWKISKSGTFAYFMVLMGAIVDVNYSLPLWLTTAEKSIKREFLSAYQGGIGSSLSSMDNKPFLDYTIDSKQNLEYISSIVNIFNEFNIKCIINDIENIIYINFDNNINNLLIYTDFIGYTYSNEKQINSAPTIEYLKIKQYNKYDDYNNISILNNGILSVKIYSISQIPVEPVYDFTTVSDNHSFVASSFVTHNCPIETPEGHKIGTIKSIAMMSSITTQNNSQEKVLNIIFEENTHIKHPADINPLEMNDYMKIYTNGNWNGVIKNKYGLELYKILKDKRKNNIIDKYTSILLDFSKKEIRIYFDGGRLIRPLLNVNDNKLNITKLETSELNKGWKHILNEYKDFIEYEDIESCNFLMIANEPEKLDESITNSNREIVYDESYKVNRYGDYRYLKYTHCEFNGWTMLGSSAVNIPFINHDYSVRSIIQFSQAKQSIGTYLTSYKDRMDISQVLYHPQIPIAQTHAMRFNNFLDLPYGENAIVALMCYTGLTVSSS